MLDAETTAIVTGAAGNIVAYMLNGRVDALKNWIARTFRDEPADYRSQQVRAVEEYMAALASRTLSEAEVRARWAATLTSYLAVYPAARAEIAAMAEMTSGSKTIYVEKQINRGSGTFIAGDMYGRISAAGREE